MLTKNEIVAAINLALDATEASKAGPIYVENEVGEKVFGTLSYNVFLAVLNRILPVAMDAKFETNCGHDQEGKPPVEMKVT